MSVSVARASAPESNHEPKGDAHAPGPLSTSQPLPKGTNACGMVLIIKQAHDSTGEVFASRLDKPWLQLELIRTESPSLAAEAAAAIRMG